MREANLQQEVNNVWGPLRRGRPLPLLGRAAAAAATARLAATRVVRLLPLQRAGLELLVVLLHVVLVAA